MAGVVARPCNHAILPLQRTSQEVRETLFRGPEWRITWGTGQTVKLRAVYRLRYGETATRPTCNRIPQNSAEDREEAGHMGWRVEQDAFRGETSDIWEVPRHHPQIGVQWSQVQDLSKPCAPWNDADSSEVYYIAGEGGHAPAWRTLQQIQVEGDRCAALQTPGRTTPARV